MSAPVLDKNRIRRRVVMALALSFFAIFLYMIWSVSTLWAPILTGVGLAYVFRPLKAKFNISWMPHEIGVVLAFLFTVLTFSVLFYKIKSTLPDDRQKIELKVRLDYKLNEKFNEFFFQSNGIMKMIGNEMTPGFKSASDLLNLTEHEQDLIEKSRISMDSGQSRISDKFYTYYQANMARRSSDAFGRSPDALLSFDPNGDLKTKDKIEEETSTSHLLHWISMWLICPLVFIFLIFDNGQIRRAIIALVPNTYFELSLTLMDRLDEAVGSYLRGTALECFLVGISTFMGLFLIGIPASVSFVLGLLCGVVNAVPLLGPTVGGLAVLSYALIAESADPILPYLTYDHLAIAAVTVVGVVHLMDNVLFAPVVLGRAVDLHPLVIIISLAAASVLFGVIGVIVAIPSIVIIKTVVVQLIHQLKSYKLI